jgi:GNAT superfamily N-acetyltransferase
MPDGEGMRIVEVRDERTELARRAVDLIRGAIHDVQSAEDFLAELEEGRRGLPAGGDYHLVAQVDGADNPVAAAAGAYVSEVNAGFVSYLAVDEAHRSQRLGRELRAHLVDAFRADARRAGRALSWTVGEVRRDSPWLRTLVAHGRAIPFGFSYFHPWLPRRAEGRYVLYREPDADARRHLPSGEVLRLVYGIWRRVYRIRFPLQSETFCYMLDQLQQADRIGPDPDFELPD